MLKSMLCRTARLRLAASTSSPGNRARYTAPPGPLTPRSPHPPLDHLSTRITSYQYPPPPPHSSTFQSYYGSTGLYLMHADGQFDCAIAPAKEGTVQDVQWGPAGSNKGNKFVVIAGSMPSMSTLYNIKVRRVLWVVLLMWCGVSVVPIRARGPGRLAWCVSCFHSEAVVRVLEARFRSSSSVLGADAIHGGLGAVQYGRTFVSQVLLRA